MNLFNKINLKILKLIVLEKAIIIKVGLNHFQIRAICLSSAKNFIKIIFLCETDSCQYVIIFYVPTT